MSSGPSLLDPFLSYSRPASVRIRPLSGPFRFLLSLLTVALRGSDHAMLFMQNREGQ